LKHSVTEHHVSGGASGLVIDVPGSDVVSLQVRFNSGFQFADPKLYEVPHVMEHVLATVTQRHPGPNQFYIEAQKNGAYVNATTGVDANGYVYECADFELDRIVNLVEEQLAEPLFDPRSLEAELGNVREELSRNTTQHASVCAVRLGEKAFPELWLDYDERIAQLPGITIDTVREHYTRTHTAANGRFFVAGHFPDGGAAIARRLDRIFRRLPQGERLERSRAMGLDVASPVVTKRDIKQLYWRAVMFFGELSEAERRALTLLRMVLVGGMGSRVLGEAREKGLAYAVGGLGYAEPGNSSFGFTGYVTPKNARPLFKLAAREFAAVRETGPTAEEVESAKDLVIGSIKRSTQTPGDIMSWYIEPYDEAGSIRDFDREMELMRQVRSDEVAAVAAKASLAARRGFSFLGDITAETAHDYVRLLEPLWETKTAEGVK
jgi:predicted Zn-dependent peptidase